MTCIFLDKASDDYFRRYITKATPPKLIERHIYAYWMLPRWAELEKIKGLRKSAEEQLAKRIFQYIKKTEDQKLKEILEGMIEDDQFLKGRVCNLSEKEIRRIVKRNLIPKRLLPDLGYKL